MKIVLQLANIPRNIHTKKLTVELRTSSFLKAVQNIIHTSFKIRSWLKHSGQTITGHLLSVTKAPHVKYLINSGSKYGIIKRT